MSHDYDLSLRVEDDRDDYVGSEVDPDALHDARRDRAREMADALEAESAHWQAQGGHPAPSVWPDGAEWPCTCIPGERCCETDCESCWRTTTCQAEDLTAAEEYATARTQEAVEARGGDRAVTTTPTTEPAPDPLRGDPNDPAVIRLVDLIRPKNTLPRGPWPTPDQPTEGGAA